MLPAFFDSVLQLNPSHSIVPMLDQAGFTRTGREISLRAPLGEEAVRAFSSPFLIAHRLLSVLCGESL
jgi:hypothetical protein